MNRSRFFLLIVIALITPVGTLMAKPKATPNASATPDPKKDPQVQKILSDLRPAYPHLVASDVVRTSNHDLRKMYEHLYHSEGMGLLESKEKAALVPLKGN